MADARYTLCRVVNYILGDVLRGWYIFGILAYGGPMQAQEDCCSAFGNPAPPIVFDLLAY